MTITKPDDYVKLTTKVIKLPSGAEFKIKRLGLMDAFSVFDKHNIEFSDMEKSLRGAQAKEIIRDIVLHSVVEPKLTEGKTTKDALCVDEILLADQLAIFNETFGESIAKGRFFRPPRKK